MAKEKDQPTQEDINSEDGIAILIYGLSASGKSTSLRNLPRDKTAILNTEKKRLPFKGENKFQLNARIHSTAELIAGMEYIENERPDIEYVVIDSLSMYADQIVYIERIENAPMNQHGVQDTQQGWGLYKRDLQNLIVRAKASKKIYIVTGLEEAMMGEGFKTQLVTSCQGSMKGKVERDFTIVLRATSQETDDNKIEYLFQTNKVVGENNQAKTPMGMIEELTYPNDIHKFVEEVVKPYYIGE